MQVDVHDVETHIARPANAKHRVEVCTIVVHQATTVVDELGNLWNTSFKESQGIRIGHHHSGNLSAFLCNNTLQVFDIDLTISLRFHLNNLQATDSGRGGVGAMGTIGHDDFFALPVATLTMIIIDGHQSGQLAMGTSIRFKSEMSQTGNGTE